MSRTLANLGGCTLSPAAMFAPRSPQFYNALVLDRLLQSKLRPPALRTHLVSRPRLVERLQAGLERPLTLISAQPGSGKTTLLAEWRASEAGRDFPLAWLALDQDDNDPARFLAYFASALDNVRPGLGESALALLHAPQPPSAQAVLAGLLDDLAALDAPFVVGLDDYHAVTAPPIHEIMRFVLEHLPAPMRLVVLTRADPPWPLARLRAQGLLSEIRALDLRFAPDEADRLLNEALGLDLSAEQVAALEARTEGWATGLQLAALSMQGREPESLREFIQGFTGGHHYIVDYLADEVLRRQPDDLRLFLLHTSILDRMCGLLCDAVVAGDQGEWTAPGQPSALTLEHLDRSNLFLVPLDDERQWYRYHRLFADVLRSRLSHHHPDRLPALHRRAARWHEQNGLPAEAIHHALKAEDRAEAARIVEQNAMPLLLRGELLPLLGWLEAVHEEAASRPWLDVYLAWALTLTGRPEQAEAPLARATLAASRASGGEVEHMLGHAAAARAYGAAVRGDAPGALEFSRQALRSLPETDQATRSVVALTLGGVFWMGGDVRAAERAFLEAGQSARAAGNLHAAIPALSAAADLQTQRGELGQAAGLFREAMDLAAGIGGRPLPVAGRALSGLARILYERNDLDLATEHARRSVELCRRWGNHESLISASATLAQALFARGDVEGGAQALEAAEAALREARPSGSAEGLLESARLRLWLRRGDLDALRRWTRESSLDPTGPITFQDELRILVFARARLALGETGAALELLDRIAEAAAKDGRTGRLIEALALQALALQAQGDLAGALEHLERALNLGEPEGFARVFLDEGPPMTDLLRRAASKGIAPGYVARLLAWTARPGETPAAADQPLIEPLTERELEVLRLIAAGQSNREIADALVVALGTVKAHTASIYRKLDVTSRTQAAARARELGLL